MKTFKNYTKASIGHEARTEFLALSGTESSINNLPTDFRTLQ